MNKVGNGGRFSRALLANSLAQATVQVKGKLIVETVSTSSSDLDLEAQLGLIRALLTQQEFKDNELDRDKQDNLNIATGTKVGSVVDETPVAGSTRLVTSGGVHQAFNDLIGGAPGVLDTLDELSKALNNDDDAFNSLVALIPTATLSATKPATWGDLTLTSEHTTLSGRVDTLETADTTQQAAHTTLAGRVDTLETADTTQQAAHTTLAGRVDTLDTTAGTLAAADTTQQAAHTTLAGRVDTLETADTTQQTAHTTLVGRVGTLETADTTQQTAHTTLVGRVDTLETADTTQQAAHTTLAGRVGTLETDDTTQQAAHTTLAGRVDTLETADTTQQAAHTTLAGRVDTLENEVDYVPPGGVQPEMWSDVAMLDDVYERNSDITTSGFMEASRLKIINANGTNSYLNYTGSNPGNSFRGVTRFDNANVYFLSLSTVLFNNVTLATLLADKAPKNAPTFTGTVSVESFAQVSCTVSYTSQRWSLPDQLYCAYNELYFKSHNASDFLNYVDRSSERISESTNYFLSM